MVAGSTPLAHLYLSNTVHSFANDFSVGDFVRVSE